MGKFILLISRYDFAGSGHKIAEAVSLNSNHYVLPIITNPYLFPKNIRRTPSLYKQDDRGKIICYTGDPERIQSLVDKADIIHFKGDSVPTDDFIQGVVISKDKPRIVTVGGTFFRRGKGNTAQPIAEISEYLDVTDFRSCITPDLNYPEFKAQYIPHTIESFNNVWKNAKIPTIAHCKSMNNKKGTDQFLQATKILKDKGYKFYVDIIENVSHTESMQRKSEATIFFDEMSGCGWFGLSAIEAISMGIPTISYMSETALNQGNIKDIPVINCGNTAESLVECLKPLLMKDLYDISKKTFEYAQSTYSYEVVGKQWSDIYDSL